MIEFPLNGDFSPLQSFFGMSFSFSFPPPPILSLAQFSHHQRETRTAVGQPKKNFFRSGTITLRIFSVLEEPNRKAPISGAFQCTQTLLEGLQDGSSPLLFVREAILQAFQQSLCTILTP